jgi:hypothetical protein
MMTHGTYRHTLRSLRKNVSAACLSRQRGTQDIEYNPVLIHGPPEILALSMDREEDFIQMPRVARMSASASELMGMGLAECPTPLADRLIGDDDAARIGVLPHRGR